MKHVKLAVVLVLAVAVLSGCATLGIATRTYVDEQLSAARNELSNEIQDNKSSIDENRSAIDAYGETAAQLEELIISIQQTVETTDELKQLAGILEQRLENLPVETIKQLVGILQEYLEDR